jgi:hypothetical protein
MVGGISRSIYYWLISAIKFLSAFLGAVYPAGYLPAGLLKLLQMFIGCYAVGLPVFFSSFSFYYQYA